MPGAGRRIGQRQDDPGPLPAAARRAGRRQRAVPRRGPAGARRPDPPRTAARLPDGLPGPPGQPQPPDARRSAPAAEPLAVHRIVPPERVAGAGGRAARDGRPAGRRRGPLPAPVLGRPAPAHRHRPGAGARAGAAGGGRAGLRPRPAGPGPGDRPASATSSSASAWRCCSSPTTWPWSSGWPSGSWCSTAGGWSRRRRPGRSSTGPEHPYTRELLRAIPRLRPGYRRRTLAARASGAATLAGDGGGA